jgi:L-lactate dehydrogenase complex protein LldE
MGPGTGGTTVALFVTCVVDVLEPEVGEAVVRVLRAAGCDVSCPPGQTCCGQPAWNSGFAEEAARVARTTLAALEASGASVIVCPAGSCTTMVRVFWPELFEVVGDHDAAARARALGARTREFSELVSTLELPAMRLPEPLAVACHQSCHMLRELRLGGVTDALLGAVEACEVLEWPDAAERCCGFGGLFSMKLPEASAAIADDKLDSLPAGAAVIAGADSSCLLHLRGRAERTGRPVRTAHVAELLARGLDGAAAGARGSS